MKKLILATALVAAFSSQVMAESTSTVGGTTAGKATDGSTPGANSGIVRFQGKVVDQTCTIDGNSQDQIVVLDTVSKNRFTAANQTAMPTPFEIKLSGCSVPPNATQAKKVKARFASAANVDTAHNYTLRNTKTGGATATNVNIQLFNEDGTTAIYPMRRKTILATATTPITHTAGDDAAFKNITEQNQTLKYIAKYYSTDANVGVGEVESAVDFELTYE
ncbi:hypothetical protein ABW51_07215 [Haemophilus sp. C1]|uniref:fimbrial protein n=1 Tax=Haemophilus sp. C1 TaxID=1661745 RepID=UPI0006ABCCC4|nr:fimbrial protein [Haemophilus sp. C1]KOQ96714.1 hypothetical protein ABW51_07215 [Haemophilus sp. C1]